jgi:ApbE superfamily uncharacterized protein (UPF0280 family)
MGKDRFRSFTVAFLDTDLWIGYNGTGPGLQDAPLKKTALATIKRLRAEVDAYRRRDRRFIAALAPYDPRVPVPGIVRIMFDAARRAGVGPMAAVAGAFAQEVARTLEERFVLDELVVENGGDNYLRISRSAVVSIFAGASPLSQKIGIEIKPNQTPLGICTSSGKVGPSLSFGKADAMTIVSLNPAWADAYATYFGNRAKQTSDIEPVLAETAQNEDILGALIVIGDQMGIRGKFPLRILEKT